MNTSQSQNRIVLEWQMNVLIRGFTKADMWRGGDGDGVTATATSLLRYRALSSIADTWHAFSAVLHGLE